MNKKELKAIATEEQRWYLNLKYAKRIAKHFFNVAVKYHKAGDIKQAKIYWGYCKNACMDAEKSLTAWDSVFHLKNLLNLPIEKYVQAVDEKALANRQWLAEYAYDDVEKNVSFSFVWRVKKTIKIN